MDTWTCYSCNEKNLIRHNVGLTNSLTDETICIKCYNKGVN